MSETPETLGSEETLQAAQFVEHWDWSEAF